MTLDKTLAKQEARDCIALWNCEPDGDMFFTHSSLLWPLVKGKDKLMLKIADPFDDEAHGGQILAYYGGCGAIRTVEVQGHIQLLERFEQNAKQPTLEQMVLDGQDDEATRIICDVITKLHSVHRQKTKPGCLIPFTNRFDDMQSHMEEGRIPAAESQMFEFALSLKDELLQKAGDDVPLHGDVHHFNIVYDKTRGWLAIDPKGFSGPAVYEYAAPLCNPYMHTTIVANSKCMDRQAAIMSEMSGINKTLILEFAFIHAMQVAAWSVHNPTQDYWKTVAKTAAKCARIGGVDGV